MGTAFLFVLVHSSANLVILACPQKGIVGMYSEIILRKQDDPITFWHRLAIKRTQSSVRDSNTEIAANTQCTVIRKELPRVRRPSLQREEEPVGARSRNGFPSYTLKLTSFTDSFQSLSRRNMEHRAETHQICAPARSFTRCTTVISKPTQPQRQSCFIYLLRQRDTLRKT